MQLFEEQKKEQLRNFATLIENIDKPLRVFDCGMEPFGDFKNGKQAAAAVETSDPGWWAMQEPPDYRLIEELEEEDR